MGRYPELRRRPPPVNVAALRRKLGMTRIQFARRFAISVRTLRHWEKGDRQPRGAARILLSVIERNPGAVLDVLRQREW